MLIPVYNAPLYTSQPILHLYKYSPLHVVRYNTLIELIHLTLYIHCGVTTCYKCASFLNRLWGAAAEIFECEDNTLKYLSIRVYDIITRNTMTGIY